MQFNDRAISRHLHKDLTLWKLNVSSSTNVYMITFAWSSCALLHSIINKISLVHISWQCDFSCAWLPENWQQERRVKSPLVFCCWERQGAITEPLPEPQGCSCLCKACWSQGQGGLRLLLCSASPMPIFTSNTSRCSYCCQLWSQVLLACVRRKSAHLACLTMCKLPGVGGKRGGAVDLGCSFSPFFVMSSDPWYHQVDKTPTCTAARLSGTILTPLIHWGYFKEKGWSLRSVFLYVWKHW